MKDEAVPGRRIWLRVAGMFALLCILVWLDEFVDVPHLLLGVSRTPINWHEAVIEMVLIASVGLYVVSRLRRDAIERMRAEEALRRAHDELEVRVEERTVELPQVNEALQADITERKRAGEQIDHLNTIRSVNRERILVVDDDESICGTLRLILKKQGYEVDTAGTGREAIEKARERSLNVALLDVKLPDMEGIELLSPLKEMHPDIAALMVTGHASLDSAVQALNAGASAYVIKPLNMDEVLNTVQAVLEKQRLVLENRRLYQEVQRELAERKRAGEQIDYLNTVLYAIRSVDQIVTREKVRDRLLQGVCDTLIKTRGYHSVWVAVLDESGEVVTTGEAGLGEQFLPLVEQRGGELPACGGTALSQPGVFVIEDRVSTCSECPLSDRHGGQEVLGVRLEHGGKVFGLLMVSILAEYTVDEKERALFAEVAGDIAFALHSMELEEMLQERGEGGSGGVGVCGEHCGYGA